MGMIEARAAGVIAMLLRENSEVVLPDERGRNFAHQWIVLFHKTRLLQTLREGMEELVQGIGPHMLLMSNMLHYTSNSHCSPDLCKGCFFLTYDYPNPSPCQDVDLHDKQLMHPALQEFI